MLMLLRVVFGGWLPRVDRPAPVAHPLRSGAASVVTEFEPAADAPARHARPREGPLLEQRHDDRRAAGGQAPGGDALLEAGVRHRAGRGQVDSQAVALHLAAYLRPPLPAQPGVEVPV